MSIGGENNKNKTYESTYFSRFRVKDDQHKLSLATTFKSGLLVLEIAELKEGFKYEGVENIYLSPTKAMLFAAEIRKFKEYLKGDVVEGKAFGVNAGMNDKVSYIGIHADADKTPMVTIGKFDGTGQIIEKATISFNKDYHYALEWNNIESMDVSKAYYDTIEVDQLLNLVEDFARNMSGALAYSVADLTRYDTNRILKKLDPVYDKLGIERYNSGNNYSGPKNNNFLDNAGRSSNHTSFDGIEDMMEE